MQVRSLRRGQSLIRNATSTVSNTHFDHIVFALVIFFLQVKSSYNYFDHTRT